MCATRRVRRLLFNIRIREVVGGPDRSQVVVAPGCPASARILVVDDSTTRRDLFRVKELLAEVPWVGVKDKTPSILSD